MANTADISASAIGSDGSLTSLLPSQYTLTINAPNANQLWGVGGTIVYPLSGSALPVGQSLLIQRILPYVQSTSVQNQGNYYSQVTEQALDMLEMQIQQLAARTTQFRGTWQTNTVYSFGDIVQDGTNGSNTKNYYICQNGNTSSIWSTDLAAGDWAISVVATVPANIGTIVLTGDVTASGSSPIATTLATVNGSPGSYTYASITVNGKGLVTSASSGSSPSVQVLNSQVITATGSFNFTAPAATISSTKFKFTLTAGGASGGGATAGTINGSGGGAGATLILYTSGLTANTSYTGIIGAGGVAATAAGSNGINSSFIVGATTYTARGGVGGGVGSNNVAGGVGGTATNGTLNIPGGDGGYSIQGNTANFSGQGGASYWGGGGESAVNTSGSGATNGTAGGPFGSGGSGAVRFSGTGTSGAGANGVFVAEWVL